MFRSSELPPMAFRLFGPLKLPRAVARQPREIKGGGMLCLCHPTECWGWEKQNFAPRMAAASKLNSLGGSSGEVHPFTRRAFVHADPRGEEGGEGRERRLDKRDGVEWRTNAMHRHKAHV
jgi:hypothetical protein